MITLQELCRHLKDLLSSDLFTDYCPNGLQVEGKKEITRIITGVSASEEMIQKAVEVKADALIVHHGLFWQGDSMVISGPKKRKLQALLDNGISLLGFHLPLDAHREVGNNWKAAEDMNWSQLEPFGIYNKQTIGVKGHVPNLSPEAFKEQLESYYHHQAHHAPGGPAAIRQVALISGGAYKSIIEAAQCGIDAFVTGNFDEPAWYLAQELGVHFFALGHAATEKVGPKALAEHLRKELNLAATFIDVPNPF